MINSTKFICFLFIGLLACQSNQNKEIAKLSHHDLQLNNDDEISKIIPKVSNWNKWGPTDEKGTINYITPKIIVRASKLIKKGISVTLARQTSMTTSADVREGKYEMQKGHHACRDYVGAVWHGFSITHLDGLCHIFADSNQMYNGYSVDNLKTDGAVKLGLEKLAAEGISGRGVLIDAATYHEGGLSLGQAILPSDLDQILSKQHTRIETGDIVFVRTGFGEQNTREKRTGLHPSCIVWAKQNEISLLGSDGDNDPHPINFDRWASPFHTIGIPYLGLPLIDNADLEKLSRICKSEDQYEFFITISPWKIVGTTSCPINPIAIF